MVHAQPNPQLKDLPQRRWSVNDYHCMIASGILTQSDHVELLEGCIIEMVPQEPPHASITSSFGNDFVMLFAGKAWVRQQLPITIAPNSEPEPDIALVRIDEVNAALGVARRENVDPNRYRDRHPVPEDVYLLIEVSHSTLNCDRHHKAKIYAKANIPEYWVVDVNQQQILVFGEPQEGSYQVEQVLGVNDAIIPLAFPDVRVELSNLFV